MIKVLYVAMLDNVTTLDSLHVVDLSSGVSVLGNCPKFSYINFFHKIVYANNADTDLQEQFDKGLNCLPFHQVFCEIIIKTKHTQRTVWH